ncbi:MAG TPA: hypothetical protein VM260_28005 [Pirellula sp.]|nr:hypothetical protein [Pirellula sp.]
MTPPPAFLSNVETPVEHPTLTLETEPDLDARSLKVTAPFVGQWHTLISQTNWEKGKIIFEWRSALIAADAAISCFSDETWTKQVGAVTSQHVGRLRRVYERFGRTSKSYPGLYWSHFLAAIDWDDAELWLEGAMRSRWSISEMRKTRWVSNGGDPKNGPRDEELITSELDDDFDPLTAEVDEESDREKRDRAESSGPLAEGPDFGDADYEPSIADESQAGDSPFESESFDAAKDPGNPFVGLPDLPPDIADALEQFKLSIVRHRASKWADISQKQMLDVLDALKLFVDR